MMRVKLEIAYDGTNYCGWQQQPNGITVEEIINRKLSKFLGEEITVIGASRTDSGVHALANVAVFDTQTKMPAEKICFALNQRLPEDIVIQSSVEVPLDFHPRRCNSIKTYEYRILNCRFDKPTQRLYTHFVYKPLNLMAMQQAASYLVGKHDFLSFSSARTRIVDTVRIVYSLNIIKEDDIITIQISGNGFLYNMVRIMVGTIIKAGLGSCPPEHIKSILESKDRLAAGPKAPGKGLTLVKIEYE